MCWVVILETLIIFAGLLDHQRLVWISHKASVNAHHGRRVVVYNHACGCPLNCQFVHCQRYIVVLPRSILLAITICFILYHLLLLCYVYPAESDVHLWHNSPGRYSAESTSCYEPYLMIQGFLNNKTIAYQVFFKESNRSFRCSDAVLQNRSAGVSG